MASPTRSTETFSAEQVQARLRTELPNWRFETAALIRTYKTGGWKGTLMVANAVGHLAEAAWHHPDLALSYGSATVKLQSHDVQGITERDFALARKIEEVVLWRPGREPNPVFEGTPDEPRFSYLVEP
jgi:4a-hydroxytetrahydrobiopterin dehydratase